MRRHILFLPVLLCTPACSPSAAPPAASTAAPERSFDKLLGLVRQRLEVMHDVARYKWTKKAPLEDPERVAALLKNVESRAADLGLDPGFARRFFRGQIKGAKVVQRADFHRWDADPEGAEGEVPDLAGVLRPRIDALNRDLLAELAELSPRMNRGATAILRGRADQLIAGPGIDGKAREAAISPLIITSEWRGIDARHRDTTIH